jgi:hypothetical protein
MPLSWLPDPRKSERAACLVTHMVLIGKYEVGRAELNASAGGWWLARCAHVTKYYGYFPPRFIDDPVLLRQTQKAKTLSRGVNYQ